MKKITFPLVKYPSEIHQFLLLGFAVFEPLGNKSVSFGWLAVISLQQEAEKLQWSFVFNLVG